MTTSTYGTNAFDTLDSDWATLCRRNRRSSVVAIWAETEPALAHVRRLGDVIPPASTDRAPIWAAIARLHLAGDNLAGRTLLQLLVPGMIRLAMRWHTNYDGGPDEAGWDVVARAQGYLGWLRDGRVKRPTASYVLRSVERDLSNWKRDAIAQRAELFGDDGPGDLRIRRRRGNTEPSAEQTYFASTQVRSMLATAVEHSAVSPSAAQRTWLFLSGHYGTEVTSRAPTNRTTVYRQHAKIVKHLRRQLLAS